MFSKKSLGQNFLKNKDSVKKIIDTLSLKDGDVIIEIGPGHGELTSELVSSGKNIKIITVEKDESLISLLQKKFGSSIKIATGDALVLLPKIIKKEGLNHKEFKILGNIPYYITGYLLRTLGELPKKPSVVILTIQKEVAERLCAKPPKMNLLAASVGLWGETKIISYIKKSEFSPVPKVDSAIIFITINDLKKDALWKTYYSFIKTLFKQPRKTILNNLSKTAVSKNELLEMFSDLHISKDARPQNLDIKTIREFSKMMYNKIENI